MEREPRSPLLSARISWIFVEIVVIFVIILGCTVFVWWKESGTVGQTGYETFKNVVSAVVQFSNLAIIYVVCIFEIGGEIMIRFTYLVQKGIAQGIEKAIAQGIEQGKAEGIEQGKVEGIEQGKAEGIAQGIEQGKDEIYRVWYADWEKRRQAAAEKGIPFDDPPPPNPDNHINQG